MAVKTTIGGPRLGSEGNMSVTMHGYDRANHNKDRQFRDTGTFGVLSPCFLDVGMPDDTWEIGMETRIYTRPTVGPVFGRVKLQIDFFATPMRLYNRQLHNNKTGIGANMDRVLLPQVRIRSWDIDARIEGDPNLQQISPSSLAAKLGIRGLGHIESGTATAGGAVTRDFMGMFTLNYAEIWKNYYSNKQEEIGYVIGHEIIDGVEPSVQQFSIRRNGQNIAYEDNTWKEGQKGIFTIEENDTLTIYGQNLVPTSMGYWPSNNNPTNPINLEEVGWNSISTVGTGTISYNGAQGTFTFRYGDDKRFIVYDGSGTLGETSKIRLIEFPISNIDDMRDIILSQANTTSLIIGNGTGETNMEPYNQMVGTTRDTTGKITSNSFYEMSGLLVKTYLSDRFNNWLNTEWIDGPNGISARTAITIDPANPQFTMDALNLMQHMYNELNRIIMGGNDYWSWIETVWGDEKPMRCESPMHMGGYSEEIMFDEVVSTATVETGGDTEPLGTLGGRGVTGRAKGGKVKISMVEPYMIMGIYSLTPRLDYSQGNEWFNRHKTMDDWHKPEFNKIGYQELLTDEIAAFDTGVEADGTLTLRSAGKQPAYTEYRTSWNRTYGNFARDNSEMFMTFNRRYGHTTEGFIQDLTTYIDPTKHNYIFTYTELDAMNFWIQIGFEVNLRSKVSATTTPIL